MHRCLLGFIQALLLVVFITLLVLEYLSGYKAGVMQHLYIQKINLYNHFYDGWLFIHGGIVVLCSVLGSIVTKREGPGRKLLVDKSLMFVYAGMWFFITVGIHISDLWPPYSHFLVFFECACCLQVFRIYMQKYWA